MVPSPHPHRPASNGRRGPDVASPAPPRCQSVGVLSFAAGSLKRSLAPSGRPYLPALITELLAQRDASIACLASDAPVTCCPLQARCSQGLRTQRLSARARPGSRLRPLPPATCARGVRGPTDHGPCPGPLIAPGYRDRSQNEREVSSCGPFPPRTPISRWGRARRSLPLRRTVSHPRQLAQ